MKRIQAAYLRPPVTPQQAGAAKPIPRRVWRRLPYIQKHTNPAYRPAACVRGFLYPRRLHAMPGYAIIHLSMRIDPARGGTI